MNNAVIFVRGNNVEGQVALCKEFAEIKGYNVIDVITDVRKITTETNIVLVTDYSRLGRRNFEVQNIVLGLSENGVQIIDVRSKQEFVKFVKKHQEELAELIYNKMINIRKGLR